MCKKAMESLLYWESNTNIFEIIKIIYRLTANFGYVYRVLMGQNDVRKRGRGQIVIHPSCLK